jgi:YNFM family putative membrane transporter
MYNYIAFPLLAPPYNLSQTAVGALFAVFLIGIFSSTLMGGLSDKYGCGKILFFSIGIMLIGAVITLLPGLFAKITGLAIFTFGFFGTHSTACSWTGKSCTTDKAQGSALYMLFYYMGSSVIGTIGGLFLSHYNWPGLIMLITIILGGALLSANLVVSEEFSN